MKTACVVLAAGVGKRMKSRMPKVLHRVCGIPMLQHVLDAAGKLKPEKRIVVAGKNIEEIRSSIYGQDITFVLQERPLGTGDALLRAKQALNGFAGTVLVLNGDMPLITAKTLRQFLNYSQKRSCDISVISFIAGDPSSYGRIVRDGDGKAVRIVEDKDATPGQKNIREVNSGVYAIKPAAMNLLSRIQINRKKGEYYLTDILEIAAKEGLKTGVYCLPAETELLGVNTAQELSRAERICLRRTIKELTEKGVVFVDPDSVYIHAGVKAGRETLIYPNVFLEGNTRIGSGCTIYPNARLTDSTIGNRAIIKDSSVIEESAVGQNAQIGPFAHLRPGSIIGPRAKIGNFVEIKKSMIGENSKASHLSYIGDATLGKNVNIGAGTITCNYDGVSKHKTEIGDKVFVGSDTQFVAPVKIGRGAYIGAGSTITKDVPPMSLAISRAQQKNIEGWAAKRQFGVRSSELKVKGERAKK